MGRLRVSGNTQKPRKVMATLGHRLNLAKNETVSCWMVQHNGGALLDGNITDYLIKRKHYTDKESDEFISSQSKEKSFKEIHRMDKEKHTEKDTKLNVLE